MPNTEADALIDPESIDENHVHVVAAILWRGGDANEFLIARRQKGKHLEDYWELPGGKLEPGEDRWRGLQRELEEEIGIRATRGEPYMRVYFRYPERNVLLDTWSVSAWRGEVSAREGQRLEWIGSGEIDSYRFPPADVPILEAIRYSATTGTRRRP